MNRRILSVVAAVGLIELLSTQASAQLADFVWNPALTGNQQWQVSTNWAAPSFPGGYPYAVPTLPNDPGRIDSDSNATTGEPTDLIVFPSVGANLSGALGTNLNLDVGATNVTVASLNMGGTASPVTTTVSSSGGKLVFENYEVNLTTPSPQVCAFGCSAAQITSGGVAGATNTISAPIQINGERLEFNSASTNNITVSGPITYFNGSTNGQVAASLRSFMPSNLKATISGNINLVDTATLAKMTFNINDVGQAPPSPPTTTSIQNNFPTGVIEISGVISDTGSTSTPSNQVLNIGNVTAGAPLSTVILSGINTYTMRTSNNRANIVLANDSALGVDTVLGDLGSGGTSVKQGNPSNSFGVNFLSDNDARKISVDMNLAQWQTVTGDHSLEWAGAVAQSNARGWDNLLPAGKTLTISGISYAVGPGSDLVRTLAYDGSGTTIVSGGLRDKLKTTGGTDPDGTGHFRKAGTGTVLVSDPGAASNFTGDVIVDQGVMRFATDTIFATARNISSNGGAIGIDTGTFTNAPLLQKLNAMWTSPNPNLNSGGLMLTAGESAASIDFTSGDLANLPNMSVAAPQTGITYTGTITPANDLVTAKPTYRLGGGNAKLTLPNSQLTGSRDLVVTNGGEVALNGVNTYNGVTSIQAKYHSTTQNQAIANTVTNVSGLIYEDTTLTVNTLLNGGVNSSIGSSTNVPTNLVIQGSTLKYVGTGANGTTNRLFTVGTGGATLDASGASGSSLNFTNAGSLAMGVAAPQSASIIDTGPAQDGMGNSVNTRTRMNIQQTGDLIVGMTVSGLPSTGAGFTLGTGSFNPFTPTFQNNQLTVPTVATGTNESGTITFGGVARTLTLTGSNTGNNTLSPLVADALAASGSNVVNVAKNGTGKWILTGNNTYTGTTTVNAGTLLINGTQSGNGLTTVSSGATLGGTGTLGGALTNNGTIAPGASVGTLSVAGNVTDGASSIWSIELSGASADKLAVTGNIDLSAVDTLNVTGAGSGTSWLIGTYTGTLTGAFDTITSGYTVTYTGGNITLSTGGCAPGDLNCDGHVDTRDYVFWRKNGLPASSYNAWRANFGSPPGSGSGGIQQATVPEPNSILLIGLALIGTISGIRHRRGQC
jgi:fibronectin-binding autotransporter adhesin